MLTKEAIQHIEQNAAAIAAPSIDTDISSLHLVPDGFKLVDMEKYSGARNRPRGAFTTTNPVAFCNYVNSRVTPSDMPACFVSGKDMKATAFLNYRYEGGVQGHCDDVAVVTAARTAAMKALCNITDGACDQKGLIEWIEDWSGQVVIYDQHGEQIPIGATIAAIRRMTIESSRSVTNTVGDFSASRSAMDDIEAKSAGTMPAHLYFTDILHEGLPVVSVQLKISVLTGGSVPAFSLRWVGAEVQREAIVQDFIDVLSGGLGERVEVFSGSFSA